MNVQKCKPAPPLPPYQPVQGVPVVQRGNDAAYRADERELRDVFPQDERLLMYTVSGHSVSLENFYQGKHAFLICSGPSLKSYDLKRLWEPGCVTMGVNNSWSVWRPNLWTSVDDPGSFIDTGWKDPKITKFVPLGALRKRLRVKQKDGSFSQSGFQVCQMPACFFFKRNTDFNSKTFLDEGSVNWGNNADQVDDTGVKGSRSVMLAATRLLYYLGFRTVYLLGCDFNMVEGRQNYAFQQERTKGSVNGNNGTYEALNIRFAAMKEDFDKRDFKVFNCFKESGLRVFPYKGFDDCVNEASKEASKVVDPYGWYDERKKK